MIFKINGNFKPLTINKAFATMRNGARVRSNEYRAFKNTMNALLRSFNRDFEAFESRFDEKIHEIHASLEIGLKTLYTKNGTISKTSGDLANFEKCLIDCVLVGKINDAQIMQWKMEKFYSLTDNFCLTLEIKERKVPVPSEI